MSDAPTKPKTAPKPKTPTVEVTAPVSGITMPEIVRTGKSIYKFADLELGECFGVKGRTKRQMANSVGQFNRKYKATDGTSLREFKAFDVDDTLRSQIKDKPDLAGADTLVFRIK